VGRELVVKFSGETYSYEIRSAGKDSVFGAEDDILKAGSVGSEWVDGVISSEWCKKLGKFHIYSSSREVVNEC